jgi:predicted NBD/HSP70 family sugar kinase
MRKGLQLPEPGSVPPLDDGFRPAALADRAFHDELEAAGGGVPLVIALERHDGAVSRFETHVFPDGDRRADAGLMYAERLLKSLLWQCGAWRVHVAGPQRLGEALARIYSPDGARRFDCRFMGEEVYERPFELVVCDAGEVPSERETARPLGRHLDGCRIGFDLGASDRKVAAVIDGTPVFSEEVVWEPRTQRDPDYHYREIMAALERAAAAMPRVDAVGGSSAGIYIDTRVRAASIFRGVPRERFGEVRTLFLRIRDELGVPLEIVNDGDVAALAGSMSLGANGVLGIALGSSEAGGYVTPEGAITGRLNELAFVPIDYAVGAAVEEWSGDRGCGAQYLSQQCVFRLAPKAGVDVPPDAPDAVKLRHVQDKLEAGHEGAMRIWESMAAYMGYAIAQYARFYELRHVLILGRCTSGHGGQMIADGARRVLEVEFPELAGQVTIHLPDETSRRVGQSIAAASLPAITERVR